MSSTAPAADVRLPQSIERYRSAILAGAPFVIALLAQLSDALQDGRPLGGIEFIQVVVGAATLAAVYFPASAWVKLAAAAAGAVSQWLVAASTDDVFTTAEVITVVSAILAAVLVGGLPNAPQTVVAEPGADVPTGSTYAGGASLPGQRDGGYGTVEVVGVVAVVLLVVIGLIVLL